MAGQADDLRLWTPVRWIITIGLIFGVQAGLFLWLGSRGKPTVPPPLPVSAPVLAQPAAEFPGLNDPTLLVKPSERNFSRVWLTVPEMRHEPAEWSGQADARLQRPERPIMADITALAATDSNHSFTVVSIPAPEPLTVPGLPELDATESSFNIQGDLSSRPLISHPTLRPQFADSALSNTVVHIDVDVDGNVFNLPVVLPGGSSGSAETDAYAQTVARSLQFKPAPGSSRPSPAGLSRLTGGTVVFHWRTDAPSPTNNPGAAP